MIARLRVSIKPDKVAEDGMRERASPLSVASFCAVLIMTPFTVVWADDVPDALSVEWQGKKPCEKLHEDSQILIARCTFAPGAMHLKHRHPAYLSYVLSGGKAKIDDDKGVREVEVKTGALVESPAIVHELTNVGTTTLQYLVVEKKYSPAPR
jgi:quercetin dioxygenase-like cupin family protein